MESEPCSWEITYCVLILTSLCERFLEGNGSCIWIDVVIFQSSGAASDFIFHDIPISVSGPHIQDTLTQ